MTSPYADMTDAELQAAHDHYDAEKWRILNAQTYAVTSNPNYTNTVAALGAITLEQNKRKQENENA